MFTIIRNRKLAALREDAARIPALICRAEKFRREAGDASQDAEAARRETRDAEARIEALTEETGRRLGSLIKAARDPVTGPGIQAQVALQVARDMIAEVKASGDEEAIESIRIMDAILGEDSAFASQPAPEAAR